MAELMGAADRARRVLSRVGDPGPGGDGGDAVIEHRPAGAESERRVAGPLQARIAGQCYGPKSHAGGRIEAGVEAPPAAARVMMPADGSRDRGEPHGRRRPREAISARLILRRSITDRESFAST